MADQGAAFQPVDHQQPFAQPLQPGMPPQYDPLQQAYPPPQQPALPPPPGYNTMQPPPPGQEAMYLPPPQPQEAFGQTYPPQPVYAPPGQPAGYPPPQQVMMPQPGMAQPDMGQKLYPTQHVNPQQPPQQFMVAQPVTMEDLQTLPTQPGHQMPAYPPPQGMPMQQTPALAAGVPMNSGAADSNIPHSDSVRWTVWPTQCICRNCGKVIKTKNGKIISTCTWIACVVMSPCGLCFCPFLMDSCKDTEQRCPECNELLHLKKAF